jgi:sterol desaturase/sphingolipid hydroxylase (fatty acid hydroxylase superfamily)
MDKAADWGRYDEKGHWKPPEPCGYMPLFKRPWKPLEVLKFLFKWGGYLWPRHLLYGVLGVVTWRYLQADLATTATLAPGWILLMLVRNVTLMLIVFGFYHLTLYVWKVQGTRGKYHPQWQQKNAKKFLFNDQVKDNMFYSIVSGATIWTAWEVLYFWLAGNGRVPLITWDSNPGWFIGLFLLIPLWRETHFYFVHRLLHWKPLLRAIHSVHHRNPNPGPWSGMSMHPVEHILYLSVVAIHFVVPSHPIHFLINAQLTALTPAAGHAGFEAPLFGFWPASDYFHYLHHKHVSCNYGVPIVPWDKWLGRFYDGEGKYSTKKA